ncbi:hypothetical protein [Flavilitoribacter nigricans]|nr:hypothetical protein [Flavilitoribacter nigricans]
MNDQESGNEFFKNYEDQNHPLLPKEAFNLELLNSSHFRYNPILTFGRTFKYLEGGYEWKQLILKFEHILLNLNFDNAKMYLETEFLGNYEFFWKPEPSENTKKLFFGTGRYSMFGTRIEEADSGLPMNTSYPIRFNEAILAGFNSMVSELNTIPIDSKHVFSKPYAYDFLGHDGIRLILTKLQLEGILEWGYGTKEEDYALYIIRRSEIRKLENLR